VIVQSLVMLKFAVVLLAATSVRDGATGPGAEWKAAPAIYIDVEQVR
jgi:hypothetical protein